MQLNKVFSVANLTKDVELKYVPNGSAVATLRLAINTSYYSKDGEKKDQTCFINAVVWNKQAEACNQYLQKGSPVFIEGRLTSRSWETPAGEKRYAIEIKADRVQFLSMKPKEEEPQKEDALEWPSVDPNE